MTKPTEGLSAVPLFLAISALLAASVSIGMAVGGSMGSNEHVRTRPAAVRSVVTEAPERTPPQYVRVDGPVRSLAPAGDPSGNDVGSSSALCPSGMRVISGGYQTITGGGETFYSDALTHGRAGWAVGAVNKLGKVGTVQAFAYCVRSGKAGPRDRRTLARQREAVRRKMKTLGDEYRALRAPQL